MTITQYAPPKINLTLRITGRRSDGYHELESLVVFGTERSGDVVAYAPTQAYGLKVQGEFKAQTPADGTNLILKIASAVQKAQRGIVLGHFTLTKTLPVASGMGGGTMDAIAALKCMQQAHDLNPALCMEIAEHSGADGLACWHAQPLIMRGIGEQIELLDWASGPMLLINPRKPLETAAVFKEFAAMNTEITAPSMRMSTDFSLNALIDAGNDLRASAARLCPEITEILQFLQSHGALYANMSGSGATCFGLFDTRETAQEVQAQLPQQWWSRLA